jgi:NAD(P)-dependent dehydrogenase (short-subunit alcohol dehydrogenase family)
MQTKRKTIIVTGASKGIGAGVTNAFIERGYNVVANSLNITASTFAATERLAVIRGDIGQPSTAHEIASTAIKTFGSIDGVINNAGIFFTKPFTEYTAQDFEELAGTNLQGYIHITQIAVKQMLAQNGGGSVTCVTSAIGGASYRGHLRFAPYGHQRRTRGDHAEPRHGVREGWHTVQRCRSGAG